MCKKGVILLFVTLCYTVCLRSNVTPDDGHGERPKHVEFLIEFLK
jgi:hypothetical protein